MTSEQHQILILLQMSTSTFIQQSFDARPASILWIGFPD